MRTKMTWSELVCGDHDITFLAPECPKCAEESGGKSQPASDDLIWEQRARILKEVVGNQTDQLVRLHDEMRGLANILTSISKQLAEEASRLTDVLDRSNER